MTLQLRLFGHLQVTDNEVPLTYPLRPRARRLLAYLVLHRHSPLARESLAFTLWPDRPEQEALGTLRRALSDLRTALPVLQRGDWLVADRAELRWNPNVPYWLDLEEYECLMRQGAPAALHSAATLYTGDLLTDFDDEWVLVERERLRQMQLNALRGLVAHHRALGEYVTALDLARQTLALDPLAEAAYRDLIALHYQAGDRAAALAEYDRLRERLLEELGVEPMAETQALLTVIARGAPLPVLEVSTTGPAIALPAAQAPPRLIGREGEMAELGALWESAAAGHGRFILMSGEAGVGKSHLALSLADYAARRGGLALVGHVYEFERALPYQAITEMLRSSANQLRYAELPPAHRTSLARLAPDVLGAVGSPSKEPETASGDMRTQLFEALLQAFLALARSQPLLLLFEDVHWAAESTLDWLTYIAPRLGASRLLVAITYRTGEVGAEHALARLGRRFAREGTVSTFSLRPLSREANRELVAHLSGLADELAAPVADRLFLETAGNPFFLREIVRGLIEAGQINISEGQWTGVFVEAAPGVEVPLPDSLRETINARVERLAETAAMFLRAAAVAGRIFHYEIVQQAGGWAEEAALAALEDLLERGFVRSSESEAERGFAFAHHLVQEAIDSDLTAPRRAYWHRRLAEATQALRPDDFEALAYHFAQAGERRQAIEYSREAARRAEGLYAYDEAIQHLRTALDLIPGTEESETRMALLEQLADVHHMKREGTQAIPLYQAALDLWHSRTGAPKMIATRLHRKIIETVADLRWSADFERFKEASQVAATSRASLEAALHLADGEPPHPETVRLLTALSNEAEIRFPPDWDAREHYARAAVDMAEQLDAPLELSAALDTLATVYGERGLFRERVQVALRRLALSHDRRASDLREHAEGLWEAGRALTLVGEYAQAIRHFLEAESLGGQIRSVYLQQHALRHQAYCWFRLDRWDDLLKVEEKWRDIQQRYPQERTGPLCFSIALSASAYALRGERDQAASLRQEACTIMTIAAGPPEHWVRSQHY